MYKLATFGLLLISALAQTEEELQALQDELQAEIDAQLADLESQLTDLGIDGTEGGQFDEEEYLEIQRQGYIDAGVPAEALEGFDYNDPDAIAALFEEYDLGEYNPGAGNYEPDYDDYDPFAAAGFDEDRLEELFGEIEEDGESFIPSSEDITFLVEVLEVLVAAEVPEAQEALTQLQAAQSKAESDAASYTDEQKVAAINEMLEFIALPDSAEASITVTPAESTVDIDGTSITFSVGALVDLAYGSTSEVTAAGAIVQEGMTTEITATVTLSEALPAGFGDTITLDYWLCAADSEGNFQGEPDECQYYQFHSSGQTVLAINSAASDLSTFYDNEAVVDESPGSLVDLINATATEGSPNCDDSEDQCFLDFAGSTRTDTEWKAVNRILDIEVNTITAEEALLARALAELNFDDLGGEEGEGEDDDSGSDSEDEEDSTGDSSEEVTAADLGVTFISGMRISYQAPADDQGVSPAAVVATADAPDVTSTVSQASLVSDAAESKATKQAEINTAAENERNETTTNTDNTDDSLALKAAFGLAAIAASILAF